MLYSAELNMVRLHDLGLHCFAHLRAIELVQSADAVSKGAYQQEEALMGVLLTESMLSLPKDLDSHTCSPL